MTDQQLIKGLLNNNAEATKLFIREYSQIIYRTCLAYTQNEHDASDLTQDVLIKALGSLHTFNKKSKLSTWIIRIAINHSINFKRSKLRIIKKIDANDEIESDEIDSVENKIKEQQIAEAIKTALNLLPKNQSKVFVLKQYNKLSYKEIAEITGLSISAVESLLMRAKSNLQKHLLHFYKQNIK